MQDTKNEDPLGLVTPNPKERCRFKHMHGYSLGWMLPDGSWAVGYAKCFECGQVDWEGDIDDEHLATYGWTQTDVDDYLAGRRHGPDDPAGRMPTNWPNREEVDELHSTGKHETLAEEAAVAARTFTITVPEGYENTTHVVLLAPGTGVVNPGDYYAHTLIVDAQTGAITELEEIGGGTIRGTLADAAKVIRADIRESIR